MKFSIFQVSRQGGRPKNEDRMGYGYTRDCALLVLADGMGGHPCGDIAAQLALQTVAARFQRGAMPQLACPSQFLQESLMAAHRAITRHAAIERLEDSPRTTLVAAVMQEGAVHWIHCGDSRFYLVRGGRLLTRTRDHSSLERPGASRQPAAPIGRHVLQTCLGSPLRPVYDRAGPVSLQQGDKILLCSDGLWASLSDAHIVQTLASLPVADAVPQLAEAALRQGGPQGDNVTLMGVEWETPAGHGASDARCGVSTAGISEGVFASTIQCGGSDGQHGFADDLDDACIERSIAEINEAIRRSAAARRG